MRKHSRMSLKVVCISAAIFYFVSPPAESSGVLNGNFAQRGKRMKAETVSKFRAKGLTCPDAKEWPDWWGCYPSCVSKGQVVEFPPTSGRNGDGYARLGGNCLLVGYNNLKLLRNFILTVWVRGQGTAVLSGTSYGKDESGKPRQISWGAARGTIIKVDTRAWVRYRHLLVKTPELCSFHPYIQVRAGTLDIDDVAIALSDPALDLIVQEEEKLYGTGALIENMDVVKLDAAFSKRRAEYESALKNFRKLSSKFDEELVECMEKAITALNPYVLTKYLTVVQAPYYNEMIAMTGVLKRLVRGPEVVIKDPGAEFTKSSRQGHKAHKWMDRSLLMDTGKAQYELGYSGCVDETHASGFCSGSIGMRKPSMANWYYGGFFSLKIDNEDFISRYPAEVKVIKQKKRGIIDFDYSKPCKIKLRFMALPNDDKLFFKIDLDPQAGISSVVMRLTAYPVTFTTPYKIEGERWIKTPGLAGKQGAVYELNPKKDWWIYYYDKLLDPALKKKHAGAGCGLLFLPEELKSGHVKVTDYGIETTLDLCPVDNSIRLILWDFSCKKRRPNAEVIAELKGNGEKYRTQLEELEF